MVTTETRHPIAALVRGEISVEEAREREREKQRRKARTDAALTSFLEGLGADTEREGFLAWLGARREEVVGKALSDKGCPAARWVAERARALLTPVEDYLWEWDGGLGLLVSVTESRVSVSGYFGYPVYVHARTPGWILTVILAADYIASAGAPLRGGEMICRIEDIASGAFERRLAEAPA